MFVVLYIFLWTKYAYVFAFHQINTESQLTPNYKGRITYNN